MGLIDKLLHEEKPTLKDYVVPIALGCAISVGGTVFLSENGGDLTKGVYEVARDILYFLLSDPYYLK